MRIPDKGAVSFYLKHYLLLSVAFFVIYGGCNYIASLREHRYQLYWAIEKKIPFVPQSIVVYLSIFLIFILPVFYVDKRRTLALAKAFVATLLVAGIFFIALPAELAHPRPDTVTFLPDMFTMLYTFALPHNLMPSLHIAFTVLFLRVCISLEMDRRLITLYLFWGTLLFISVLIMRQHQLIDIPTGALLGWMAYRFIYVRSLR